VTWSFELLLSDSRDNNPPMRLFFSLVGGAMIYELLHN
jgi:hypothetical protein